MSRGRKRESSSREMEDILRIGLGAGAAGLGLAWSWWVGRADAAPFTASAARPKVKNQRTLKKGQMEAGPKS